MASSSLIISWLSLSPVYPCFLLEPRQATCSHGLHVQCWPLTRDCFLSFFFHAAFWVTSPGSASSSLILHTTASNFLLNLSTEFSISFIIFLFLEFFPYLPSHCWSSFVHLLLILSFILSRSHPQPGTTLNYTLSGVFCLPRGSVTTGGPMWVLVRFLRVTSVFPSLLLAVFPCFIQILLGVRFSFECVFLWDTWYCVGAFVWTPILAHASSPSPPLGLSAI